VQEAFRGVLACQGPGNPSLPGKARGYGGKDTVEHNGVLDAGAGMVDQAEAEMAALSGAGMIDDFRLRGSRRCRQTNAPPKKPRWRVQVARDFDNHNAFLSEGAALAVVVESFPGTPRGG